jgi:two-component sensor histidine kinase
LDRVPAIRRAILADVPPLQALGWSVLAVAAATALRWAIDRGGAGIPFLTYFPALTLVALFLGWRWGAAVALASGIAANRLLSAEPIVAWSGGRDTVLAALFVLSCAALVSIGEIARRTVREVEAAKAREEALNRELLHRVKNMLATVNAMAVLTARHSEPDGFIDALSGRMQALERATGLLGVDENAPCETGQLVEAAIAPFRAGDNFRVEGPPCDLPRAACVPLSLALHELATNAVKYGALSAADGRVSLAWTLADGVLRLVWHESGGPPVAPPRRRGMGTQLLRPQAGLAAVELDFRRDGVRCEIAIEGVGG